MNVFYMQNCFFLIPKLLPRSPSTLNYRQTPLQLVNTIFSCLNRQILLLNVKIFQIGPKVYVALFYFFLVLWLQFLNMLRFWNQCLMHESSKVTKYFVRKWRIQELKKIRNIFNEQIIVKFIFCKNGSKNWRKNYVYVYYKVGVYEQTSYFLITRKPCQLFVILKRTNKFCSTFAYECSIAKSLLHKKKTKTCTNTWFYNTEPQFYGWVVRIFEKRVPIYDYIEILLIKLIFNHKLNC